MGDTVFASVTALNHPPGVDTLWGIPLAHPLTDEERARIAHDAEVWEALEVQREQWARMEEWAEVGRSIHLPEPEPETLLRVGGEVDTLLDQIEYRRQIRAGAEVMYRALCALGCELWVEHGALRIEPVHIVPPRLLADATAPAMREQLEGMCDERRELSGIDVSPLSWDQG